MFSSPFSGTFFQLLEACVFDVRIVEVFVPFLGDLFSIYTVVSLLNDLEKVFVPFLGDLFSMNWRVRRAKFVSLFSSPFSGTFFQSRACEAPARLLSRVHSRRGWGNRFIRHSPSEMKCRFSQSGRASAGICNEKTENEKWWCGAFRHPERRKTSYVSKWLI